MKIIKREMKSTQKDTEMTYCRCQASFNSDGNITLRNYDVCDKDKDEILVLSDEETQAIFDLIKKLKKHDMLPFQEQL